MNNRFIPNIHDFSPAPYMKEILDKMTNTEKVVTIYKTGSTGPSFCAIDIQKDCFLSSPEEIERNIKKRLLPDYVKKALKEMKL